MTTPSAIVLSVFVVSVAAMVIAAILAPVQKARKPDTYGMWITKERNVDR